MKIDIDYLGNKDSEYSYMITLYNEHGGNACFHFSLIEPMSRGEVQNEFLSALIRDYDLMKNGESTFYSTLKGDFQEDKIHRMYQECVTNSNKVIDLFGEDFFDTYRI